MKYKLKVWFLDCYDKSHTEIIELHAKSERHAIYLAEHEQGVYEVEIL
jgi:hypothetical protein